MLLTPQPTARPKTDMNSAWMDVVVCPRPTSSMEGILRSLRVRTNGHPLAHLPAGEHGVLEPLKPDNYGRLRAYIMQLLRGS